MTASLSGFPRTRALALTLGAAALLYLLAALLGGPQRLLDAAARLGWSGWLLLLLASSLNYLLRFGRWSLYLHRLGHRVPVGPSLAYYLSGFALTATPGKAGETIRSAYLKAHGVPWPQSLAMFFTERLLDVVVVTLLATLSVLQFDRFGPFVLGAAGALVLALPLLRSPWVVATVEGLALRIGMARLRRGVLHLASLLDTARDLLAWRPLYAGLGLGALAWLVQGLAFLWLLSVLELPIAPTTALAIYAASLLAGALSFVPGGIGTTEAVMGLLLHQAGADPATAVAAPIINRLTTLWYAVCLGLLASLRLGFRPARAEGRGTSGKARS